MVAQGPSRRQHVIGVCLSLSVAVIWVGSSELIQFIFGKSHFPHPYFLTYLTSSLFGVLLVGFVRKSWRSRWGRSYSAVQNAESDEEAGSDSPSDAKHARKLSVREVAIIAAKIAPLYSGANYLFNSGLGKTSVSSSSSISTLSTLFTLIIGAVAGVEKFSFLKLVACLTAIAGTIIISGVDGKKGKESLIGDALSVASALMFSIYTTVIKFLVPDDDRLDIAMMLAFMGLFTFLIAWPGLPILHYLQWERFELPSGRVFGLLLLNAFIGSVLSDFLWAKSVVLTSPLLGNTGLALTVPLSLLVDSLTGKIVITPQYAFGASLVVIGFVLVNVSLARSRAPTGESVPNGTTSPRIRTAA